MAIRISDKLVSGTVDKILVGADNVYDETKSKFQSEVNEEYRLKFVDVDTELGKRYLKTDTYSATEVDQLLEAMHQFLYEVVSELPEASKSTMHKIYLVSQNGGESGDSYNEYITLQIGETYRWENIGNTRIDMSGKADKVSGGTKDNFTSLDANGNLVDSGYNQASFEHVDATILRQSNVVDNLRSESTKYPLSANQGNILNQKIPIFSNVSTTVKDPQLPYLRYEAQVLSETQIDQVIENLGFNNVVKSGSWTDLSEKPEKLSEFTDDLGNTPSHTHPQYLVAMDLLRKAERPSQSTQGDIAILDAQGNLEDSGVSAASIVTQNTSTLVNYYTKLNTYSKSEVDQLISTIGLGGYKKVTTLPSASSSTTGTIYLLDDGSGILKEYITTLSSSVYSWVFLGNMTINLGDYVTTEALNTTLSSYPNQTVVNASLSGKVDKLSGYGLISNEDKEKLGKCKPCVVMSKSDYAALGDNYEKDTIYYLYEG